MFVCDLLARDIVKNIDYVIASALAIVIEKAKEASLNKKPEPKTKKEYKAEIDAFKARIKKAQGTKQIKWTTALVRELFAIRGFVILDSWVYTENFKAKIPFLCRNGHRHEMNLHSFSKGDGCPICGDSLRLLNKEEKELVIRFAFKIYGRIINPEWEFSSVGAPIPYWCEEGDHAHEQSWSKFYSSKRIKCTKCTEAHKPGLTKVFKSQGVIAWVHTSATVRAKKLGLKVPSTVTLGNLMTDKNISNVRCILNDRKGNDTDHKIPLSFFRIDDAEELVKANSFFNLRNINKYANISRSDNLTISEIVLSFHDRRLRELYNSATNFEQKMKKDLPSVLPVEDKEFEKWCEEQKRKISSGDKYLFERWTSKLEFPIFY